VEKIATKGGVSAKIPVTSVARVTSCRNKCTRVGAESTGVKVGIFSVVIILEIVEHL
jgi:hypothetical protein